MYVNKNDVFDVAEESLSLGQFQFEPKKGVVVHANGVESDKGLHDMLVFHG